MGIVYKDMVTLSHQDIAFKQILAHLDCIKKDLVILQKSDFANLRSGNEEESARVRAEAKLDINLERSMISDMFTKQEKKLSDANTEFRMKKADIDHDKLETKKKLDTDVASLKTLLASLKLETIRYLAVTAFTCLTIILSFYQLWK
ncbi:hypothetical protein CRUP_016548 [Coryphaenoides rupestris]|nr:hypothetical protein CRUP_016548 [Coryphaenoides rupestris]